MKASLIYCRQFEARLPKVVGSVSDRPSVAKATVAEEKPQAEVKSQTEEPENVGCKPHSTDGENVGCKPHSTDGENVGCKPHSTDGVKEPKKRGRKPNPKKEIPAFVVEKKDIILDFS